MQKDDAFYTATQVPSQQAQTCPRPQKIAKPNAEKTGLTGAFGGGKSSKLETDATPMARKSNRHTIPVFRMPFLSRIVFSIYTVAFIAEEFCSRWSVMPTGLQSP